ncbi:hypothetical protein EI983_11100 [Roseovarius faecimaris]|uniref:Asparagine synthetase domain-containing protein n=1 Tax=Roseovarius faecimaris TaxID=2494550 RepID=A0A6I6ITX7_9RHOB|nr:hypothetical protein [Roseovarius faecimaris]QGX98786.1 hypothetical protein EI983_11100 [Roseovarius faecimaris]
MSRSSVSAVPQARIEELCRTYDIPSSDVLAQQWVLTRDYTAVPDGLIRAKLGDWYLWHGPDLPLARTSLKTGGQVAVLGVAVDDEGQVIDARRLRSLARAEEELQALIDRLILCAGRYVIVVHTPRMTRVYPDGFGSLGVVYDHTTRRVGATVNLTLTRAPQFNRAYPLTGNALIGMGRFAFGQTEDRVVKRLLPNHFLNLKTFKPVRFWPGEDALTEPTAAEEPRQLGRITARLEQVIAALVRHAPGQVHLPVSGGLDSRLLLACAKPHLPEMRLFSHTENVMSRTDLAIAGQLAGALEAPLDEIDPAGQAEHRLDEARRARLARTHQIITGAMAPPSSTLLDVLYAHPPGGLILRGNGADFLKAVLWRRGVREYSDGRAHETDMGIRMMMLGDGALSGSPEIRSAYEAWFATLPAAAQARPYDLMFAEQFLAHGFGNLLYSFTNNFYICPFNDRRLLGWAAALPPDKRAELRYHLELMNAHAPELAGIGYTRKAVNAQIARLNTETCPVARVA